MNEKSYKKRLDFQQKIISKKSEEIESLKLENDKLKLQIEEKNNVINSIEPMRKELAENIAEVKKHKEKFESLVYELKDMKEIMNQEVFKGRWWLVKHIIKLGK